jgi:hypothetical protein
MCLFVHLYTANQQGSFYFIFILFICAYNVWVISPPFPSPPPLHAPPPLPSRYPAETILPLSLLFLKREYKQ